MLPKLTDYEIDYAFVKYEKVDFEKSEFNSKYAVHKTYFNECDYKSVLVVIIPYHVNEDELRDGVIASFACGSTYQYRVEKLLKEICTCFEGSMYSVDSNEVNERYYAAKSGLGYIGKNSMFISNKYGANCYIGLVYLKEKYQYSEPIESKCGECNLCAEACQVNAIKNGEINCNVCISEKLQNKHNLTDFNTLGSKVYGCDDCLKACPHLKYSSGMVSENIDLKSNLNLTKQEFDKFFKNKSFYWIGYRTFIRNVHVAYINRYQDYTQVKFLNESNSEYLKKVYQELEGNHD